MRLGLLAVCVVVGVALSAAYSFGDSYVAYSLTGFSANGTPLAAQDNDAAEDLGVASVSASKSTTGTGSSEVIGVPFNGTDSDVINVDASAATGALHVYAQYLGEASDAGDQAPDAVGNVGGGIDLSYAEALFTDTMTVTSRSRSMGANLTVHGGFVIENSSFTLNVDQNSNTAGTFAEVIYTGISQMKLRRRTSSVILRSIPKLGARNNDFPGSRPSRLWRFATPSSLF